LTDYRIYNINLQQDKSMLSQNPTVLIHTYLLSEQHLSVYILLK